MNIINIEHISKLFGDKLIFDDASFGLQEGDKVGIVGINGTGKSTLLRMAAGEETPDSGQIIRQNNLKMAYLPQTPEFPKDATVLSYALSGDEEDWQVQSNLVQLGITEYDAKLDTLSGGQRRKVALAKVLASDFDVLILDEPTNHLDNAMLSWLEDYLKNYRGTVFMVTHDRYFLDKVSNRILEISHGKMYSYDSNYSRFLELKAEREEMELASERKRQSILRMELEWAKRGCRARSTKQRARLERLEVLKNGTAPTADTVVEMDAVETRMGKKTIEFHNVSKAFGDKTLMKDFEYIFLRNQSVGIIGPNGCGKSTMLRMITGEVLPDAGTIEIGDTIRIGYLAQEEPDMDTNQRVIDYVKDIAEYVQTRDGRISASQMLERFLFTPDMQYTPISKLSGGEKRRLYLLSVLVSGANVLILDEPSNNVDIPTLTVLEDFLNTFVGIVITVSHDRYFLDRTVTRIIEILDGKAEFYSGNYSFYAIEKERRYQERMKQYLKEQAKIQQLEKAAEQMHLWAFMGNDALHKRAFSMEKRIERMRTTQKPTKARRLEARFQSREFKGDEVLQIKGVSKAFGEKRLFEDVYLRCEGGERIALLGENGTGKTTLLNMLTGSERPDSGVIRLGPAVKAAYLPQVIHFEHPERSILDTMLYELDITPQSARNRLAAYQFTGEDVFKSVSVLSGGELSRLRLCMLMDESINLLILDEPTNHLDIDSREWLEQAVEAFDGTLLFVSHDRYFINRFATRVWELAGGVITDYPMGFAQYRQAKEEERAAAAAAVQVQSAAPKKNGSRGNRAQQAAKKQLTICETAIARLEADSARLEAEMAENACDAEKLNALYQEQQDVQKRLEQEMERWEELSLQAEEQEER